MRLGTFARLLFGAALLGAAFGQDTPTNGGQQQQTQTSSSASPAGNTSPTSPTPTPTTGASRSATPTGAFLTTITSVVPNPNGGQSATIVVTLTLAVNNTASSSTTNTNNNATTTGIPTNGTINANSTMDNNGTDTNSTMPLVWNDTMAFLPFTPRLDAAFGLGGGLLIVTGIPVATLGGKNRWSALAIISGYSVGLFCLVMIMSFGVTPALQPPSPHPPSDSMRGLYLLAVGVSFLIGGALGIFFYTFAKYWVGAAGGFALGWYIVALRKGGLVRDVGPRWAIIGGLTVASLLAALTPMLHEYVLLISSAFVGATAFTLGVDCFTRAGLKEFYIYNLGYAGAFPSLNGGKFPLTQNMQVELGVIAAAALIAGAVQFKVVNMLQKRRKRLAAEEEARIEAEEISKAAEHFKNVDAELAEWEGKYGNTDSSSYTLAGTTGKSSLPTLRHQLATPSSSRKELSDSPPRGVTPINEAPKRRSLLEEVLGTTEDATKPPDTPATPLTPGTPATPLDPELEQKLQLLAEVRRARQSIRSSMDHLRNSTVTPPLDGSITPGTAFNDRPGSPARSRHDSTTSSRILDRGRYDSGASSLLLLNNGHERKGSTASARVLDESRKRDSLGNITFEPSTVAGVIGNRLSLADVARVGQPNATDARPKSDVRPLTEWELYVQSRNIVAPAATASPPQPTPPPVERYSVVSDGVGRALNQRADRSSNVSFVQPPAASPGQEYGANLARTLNTMAPPSPEIPATGPRRGSGSGPPRRASKAMTTDELAERHREMLTRMQDRVSGPIKEEQALAAAKKEWEERQKAEREEQRRRERRAERGDTSRGPAAAEPTPPRSSERSRRTDEWRRSVNPGTRPMSPPRRQSTAAGAAAVVPTSNSARPQGPTRRSSRNTFIA